MRVLGGCWLVVCRVASGRTRRWRWSGDRRLLDRAVISLRGQCTQVILVRRGETADGPKPGSSPLCGRAGALLHAADHGLDAVLSSAVDHMDLPQTIREQ